MSACLAQQEPLKIAYLGPEGTFTQAAVLKHFGHSVKGLPVATIEEVFQEVESAVADFGVVPVENSTEGAVNSTLDMFLVSELKIAGEVELRVNQNFMSKARDLCSIERVYAHAQSLAQCRGWLRKNLPKAERIAVSSNAEAARRARNAEDCGAIGNENAADIYGLNLLARHIEDRADNTTRFLVIGREILGASGRDKTSLLLTVRDQPGALYHLLDPLAKAGISMTRIESRPSRQGKWDYAFFIDVEGHINDSRLEAVLGQLGPASAMIKVLGSYPVAITE